MKISDEIDLIRTQADEDLRGKVSVALFGQPGAGKSSLINRLIGRKAAEVGVETDKTVEQGTYEHNGILLVDLPGYGTKGFPKEDFFAKFEIQQKDLFLCVTSGKLHQSDTEFFDELTSMGKVCIFVSNKLDELWEDGVAIKALRQRKIEDISRHVGRTVPVIFTSCRTAEGLDELQDAIQDNLAGAKKEHWLRSAKAYSKTSLERKKAACESRIRTSCALSALNGINPIPGADIAVDAGVLLILFKDIREFYGLSDDALESLRNSSIPVISQAANRAIQYAAKEGVLILLKRFLGRQTIKTISKYIPFVGQAVAASAGFGITYTAGHSYLDDCHALASEIFDRKLQV